MKIKKNDKVLIIAGKDKGKKGAVVRVMPVLKKVVVEGVNIRKKHTRPKKEGQKGQIIQMSYPIDVSNMQVICGKCEKATRVGYKIDSGRKSRVCRKCSAEI